MQSTSTGKKYHTAAFKSNSQDFDLWGQTPSVEILGGREEVNSWMI